MSLLKKNNAVKCMCRKNPEHGLVTLQVVHVPTSLHDPIDNNALSARQEHAQHLQANVVPHLYEVPAYKCEEGISHAFPPTISNLSPLKELPEGVTMRITHMKHGIDEQALCAEVKQENIHELLTTGATSIQAPNDGGTFKLKSMNKKNISEMQFMPNRT